MGIDLSRVATSALQAALEDGQQPEGKQHHRRLTAGKAMIAGAAVAVAAKYAVDKTSGLKGKAAMAALRHSARSTFGELVPESLHNKLMDSGFFDQGDDGVGVKDFFNQSDDSESVDQDFSDEPEDEGGDEREDEEPEEPEDDIDEDDEPEEDEGDDPDDEPEGDAEAGPEDDVDEDDEPQDDDGARRAKPG